MNAFLQISHQYIQYLLQYFILNQSWDSVNRPMSFAIPAAMPTVKNNVALTDISKTEGKDSRDKATCIMGLQISFIFTLYSLY